MVMAPKRTTNVAVVNAATWIGWNPRDHHADHQEQAQQGHRRLPGAARLLGGGGQDHEVGVWRPAAGSRCHDPCTRKASPSRRACWARFPCEGPAPPPDGQHLEAVVLPEFDLGQGLAGDAGARRQRDLDDAHLVGLDPGPGDVLLQLDVAEGEQVADPSGLAGDEQLVAGPDPLLGTRRPAASLSLRMIPATVSPTSSPMWLSRMVVPTRPEPAWIRSRNICVPQIRNPGRVQVAGSRAPPAATTIPAGRA